MNQRGICQWIGLGLGQIIGLSGICAAEQLLAQGHYDLGIQYELERGWSFYVYDYEADELLDARRVLFWADAAARRQIPDRGGQEHLGAPGETIWILPEIPADGVVYLGIGTQRMERNIFSGGLSNRGAVDMRLLSVTGSGRDAGGDLVMWQSEGAGLPPRVFFSTRDGIGPEDQLSGIPANFHAHYNWGFTAPGEYRVSFEVAGELLAVHGGGRVSGLATFRFWVGERQAQQALRTIRDGHVDLWLRGGTGEPIEGVLRVAAAGSGDGGSGRYEFVDPQNAILFAGAAAARRNPALAAYAFLGGLDRFSFVYPQAQRSDLPFLGIDTTELAAIGISGPIEVHLESIDGPGTFHLYQVDPFGDPLVRLSSSDNRQQMTVASGTHLHFNWAFSEPGDYRIGLRVAARMANGEHWSGAIQQLTFRVAGPLQFIAEGNVLLELSAAADGGMDLLLQQVDGHADAVSNSTRSYFPSDVSLLLGGDAMAASTDPFGDPAAVAASSPIPRFSTAQPAGAGVPRIGIDTRRLDPHGLTGAIEFSLLAVEGAGRVWLLEQTGSGAEELHWDSADADRRTLLLPAGGIRAVDIAVSHAGEYRLIVAVTAPFASPHGPQTATFEWNIRAGGWAGFLHTFSWQQPDWVMATITGRTWIADWPWLWSERSGWLFAAGEGGRGQRFASPGDGWIWSSTNASHYFYSWTSGSWRQW